jgi:hypothetical protein
MTESEQQSLIDTYLAAYNRFDIDGMLATLAADVRFENWSGDALTVASDGSAAFRDLAEQGKAMFSERRQRITALRSQGNTTVATIAWSGVLATDIPDGPRKGERLAVQGESAFRFAGERIAAIIDRS